MQASLRVRAPCWVVRSQGHSTHNAPVSSSAPWLLLLIALAAVMHAPFLGGGWLTDDFVHLAHLQQGSGLRTVLASPDAFGFYRPVSQASLLLDGILFGPNPAAWRATNLLLHLAVIGVSFLVARLLLGTGRAALLATLAFALTPKAHPIAVLWISARAELLMALFSFLAVACWMLWDRGRTGWWLAAAAACYALALSSKETAALLPMLLLVTPPRGAWFSRRRVAAAALLACAGAALFLVRARVGALMPLSYDPHYNLLSPLHRWVRNVRNYLGRALPSPAALLLTTAAAALVRMRPLTPSRRPSGGVPEVAAVAAAWFLTFMAPVLPIVGRSEVYLYLPVFGICLLAGYFADRASLTAHRTALAAALSAYIAVLGGFQVSRAAAMHEDLVFSDGLARALAGQQDIRDHTGVLLLVPEDPGTERHLKDAVGGYLDIAIKRILGRGNISAWVAYAGEPQRPSSLQIGCAFRDDRVILRRLSDGSARAEGRTFGEGGH